MFCKFCGNEIDEDVVVCPKCGKQVKELKRESSDVEKTIKNIASDKNAWYFEWWFIIVMFIVFFPVGIVLLVLKLNNENSK